MKVRLFIAVLLTMALGACSQHDTEIESFAQRKTIGFSIKGVTRADIRDVKSVCDDGFKYTVNWGDVELYKNVTASWEDNEFKSKPLMLWPQVSEEQPCVFNAVSYPGIPAEPISYKDGKNFFSYTVAKEVENQKDVLVASEKATEVPVDGVQHMTFRHALTKVNFTIYVDDNDVNNDYVWRVSSVSLKAKDSGVYTFGDETPWNVADSYSDMQYLKKDQTSEISKGTPWKGENHFMLIPQTGEDLTVNVTWAVYYKTGKMLIKVSEKDATRNYTISTTDWKPGASIRYSSLRLPNIGEKTAPGEGPGGGGGEGDDEYDDNNMKVIGYNPDCN